jgi:hypothetical protein
MEGAPALGGEAVAAPGQPLVLEGGEGLGVELAAGLVSGGQEGLFQIVDGGEASG